MNHRHFFPTETTRIPKPTLQRQRFSQLQTKYIRIFIVAAVLGVVALGSFFSPWLASSHSVKNASQPNDIARLNAVPVNSFLPFQETIATFASDCTTPKSAFVLGEEVCAKTADVDLNFPGGRWVNWIRPNLSVAFGGSGVTDIEENPQEFKFIPDVTGAWKVSIAETGDISQTPAVFTVASPALATFAADCTTPKTLFNLGDTVCAKSSGIDPAANRRFAWTGPNGLVRAFTPIVTDPQTDSFNLPATDTSVVDIFVVDNRGRWNVKIVNAKGTAVVIVPFQVQGAVASADLNIGKSVITDPPDNGEEVTFSVSVTNVGPNPASDVEITDDTPSNASFVSVSSSDPSFTCNGTSTVTCTGASLAVGATVTFEFVYTATGAAGSTITNIASVTSDTAEVNNLNNSATAEVAVGGGGGGQTCSLECRTDIITTANTTQGTQSGAIVTFSAPDAFGDCGAVTSNPASGSFFPVGTTVVTATSATGGGSCTFNVRVVEVAAPTITCPLPDILADAGAGGTEATVNINAPSATGTDVTVTGVRGDSQLINEVLFPGLTDPFPVGTTTITWNAVEHIDGQPGRNATCTQKVIVSAPDAPTISCPAHKSFTVTGCNVGKTLTAGDIGTPSTSGNGITVEADRSDGLHLTNDPYPVGTTVITWTATDSIGRVVSCSQNITITNSSDTIAPTISAPPNVVVTTNSCGMIVGETELGTPVANDDCGFVNVARTGVPPGNFFPTGTTTITYTATDGAGNTAIATQTVTVTESPAILPVISCPANIVVNLPLNSTATSTVVNYTAPVGTDNCAGATTTQTAGLPSGASFSVGTTTNTFRVTDRSGNVAECSFTVTVLYNFTGFFQPVDNLPTFNVVSAGKGVPVKFSLSGNKGLNIFAPNSPSSITINCDGSLPQDDVEETVNAGGSSLSYDAATDTYNYVWKTLNPWKNTCRQLVVVLNDGTEHRANFKFK